MSYKKSKFYSPTPFRERALDFLKSLPFWRSRKKGMIVTMKIEWKDIRAVFFPRNFHEKYSYLGYIPWSEEGDTFKAIEPLVIFMDYKDKTNEELIFELNKLQFEHNTLKEDYNKCIAKHKSQEVIRPNEKEQINIICNIQVVFLISTELYNNYIY